MHFEEIVDHTVLRSVRLGSTADLIRIRIDAARVDFHSFDWMLWHLADAPRAARQLSMKIAGRAASHPSVPGTGMWLPSGVEVRLQGYEGCVLDVVVWPRRDRFRASRTAIAPFFDPWVSERVTALWNAPDPVPPLAALLRQLGLRERRRAVVPTADDALPPARLQELVALMRASVRDPVDLDTLADRTGLSRDAFSRAFAATVGIAPTRYYLAMRVEEAATLLTDPDGSISIGSVAMQCGFYDQSHFHRHFRRWMGETPGRFRRRHLAS